ncbi:MAG: hypothetical protein SFW09_15195 [Hyphomicrobiaceae bacterium]|nr:hypothetical protein [Hyphomicrobiaceae bacterium]
MMAIGATNDRSEYLAALAKRLYILAWIIEIIAVSLGLGMALTMNSTGQNSFADFLLGGGGFVMVSCAELSKIPLATFFVESDRKRVKLATLGFLILVSFITFETIFFSLERGFNGRMQQINASKEKIGQLERDFVLLAGKIKDPNSDAAAERAALGRQREEAESQFKADLDAIDRQLDQIRQGQVSNTLSTEIKERVQELDKRIERTKAEQHDSQAAAEKKARNTNSYFQRLIDAARKSGDAAKVADLQRSQANHRSGSFREQAELSGRYRGSLEKLESERQMLLRKSMDTVVEDDEQRRREVSKLADERSRLMQDRQRKILELDRRLAALNDREEKELAKLPELVSGREKLKKELDDEQQTHRGLAASSQIHRIAAPVSSWITGTIAEPHTVAQSYVRGVALVWFGSLAALGAIGGAVIAMVSQLLRKRADTENVEQPRNDQRQPRLLQYLAALRDYRTAKPIIKEVEVIRTKREIVAVPVPVTDFTLEKFQKEFADLSRPLSGVLTEPGKTK